MTPHSSQQSGRYRPVCYPDCENEKRIRKDERDKVLDEVLIKLSKLQTKEKWMDEYVWWKVIEVAIKELRQGKEGVSSMTDTHPQPEEQEPAYIIKEHELSRIATYPYDPVTRQEVFDAVFSHPYIPATERDKMLNDIVEMFDDGIYYGIAVKQMIRGKFAEIALRQEGKDGEQL